MHQNLEIELKMLVSEDQFEELLSHYLPHDFIMQTNYYYASRNSDHYAFRVREKEGRKLFTLKKKTPDGVLEYEKYFEGKLEDDPEIVEVLNSFNEKLPAKLLGTLTTYRYTVDTGLAELCFDINQYNDIQDYEIEYEVKKDHDYLSVFKEILSQADIEYVPNKVSKYRRFTDTMPNHKKIK